MSDPRDREEGLDAEKRRLEEMKGRPFDVDKILAQNRAKEERAQKVAREAAQKLEHERAVARERRNALRMREIEQENKKLTEKEKTLEDRPKASKGEPKIINPEKSD